MIGKMADMENRIKEKKPFHVGKAIEKQNLFAEILYRERVGKLYHDGYTEFGINVSPFRNVR